MEKISGSSKERENESSRGRKSKEKKRLKEDERKKHSEEPEQKDTVAKFPNKKIGAMVTDAAIQRILRVGLVYDPHSFMYQFGPLGPNLYIYITSFFSKIFLKVKYLQGRDVECVSALSSGKYFKPPVPEKRHTPEGFGLCHVCQVKNGKTIPSPKTHAE